MVQNRQCWFGQLSEKQSCVVIQGGSLTPKDAFLVAAVFSRSLYPDVDATRKPKSPVCSQWWAFSNVTLY